MPIEDMHIIYASFADSVIRESSGKLVRIDLHLITPDYLLAVPPAQEAANRGVVWILKVYHTIWAILTLNIGVIKPVHPLL
jgi:hypothetical protein